MGGPADTGAAWNPPMFVLRVCAPRLVGHGVPTFEKSLRSSVPLVSKALNPSRSAGRFTRSRVVNLLQLLHYRSLDGTYGLSNESLQRTGTAAVSVFDRYRSALGLVAGAESPAAELQR